MYYKISKKDFHDAFNNSKSTNFSYNGLEALYDYLIELEENIDEEFELDVIAICCNYTEESLKYLLNMYLLNSLEELQDNTTVIEVSNMNTYIIQNY